MKHLGLSDEQVKDSKSKYGDNRISEVESEGFLSKLIGNLKDPMILILCVALAINVVFTLLGHSEWIETLAIAAAVILATLVSTFSEYRNENAFQKLQAEASQIKCKVYRNSKLIELPIDDIVVGDCIILQTGDKVPADGIMVDGSIKVDQSVLNGESKEAAKISIPDGYVDKDEAMDFLNTYKVFRGTVVCAGNGVMQVSVVGDKSVYGQIASELQTDEERDSPLKVKLGKLANDISKFGYIGGCSIAVALLFQRIVVNNNFDMQRILALDLMVVVKDFIDAIMLAVIIIVMAVPEGLPLMIAIVSALNMGKMLKDNVLVRKISGIETAGSLNILFSDKTGTITKGQLEAVIFVDGEGNEATEHGKIKGELNRLVSLCTKFNTGSISSGTGADIKIIGGNATERALMGFTLKDEREMKISTVNTIPFNSSNKYSAAQVQGDFSTTLIKGAPEKILSACKYYYDENGNKKEFTSQKLIDDKINELANRAIRVLALATTEDNLTGDDNLPKGEWTLVGVVGIRDEVRPESVSAISEVQSAGVQVVMITGDRKDTAVAIAKEAGLLTASSDLVMLSDELAKMSDDEIKAKLSNIRVVARALPTDKSRLVRLAQEMNLVVGMTGDGVNDSPALKKSDVGFGMGSGTEVAKEASDIVILDDNFNSIGKAILYGRTIFNSIRKFIIYQMTINAAAVSISFIAPLMGMESPLSITQILWINLIMDTLAAIAFGGEPALRKYMQEKPKSREENIINKYMWSSILTGGAFIFVVSMIILATPFAVPFFRSHPENLYLLTGYFTFFIFADIFNAFNCRTDSFNLLDNIGKNKGFIQVIGLIFVVQVLMTYFGGDVLRTYGLTAGEWVFIIALSICIIPIDLLRKAIFNKIK